MHRRATLLTLSLAGTLLLGACASYSHRGDLRQGRLALDTSQASFLNVWGNPTHTAAVSGDEVVRLGIAGWGGFFFKGRQMYEMWEYDARQTQLVFYDRRLVAWKTQQTVEQLAGTPTSPARSAE